MDHRSEAYLRAQRPPTPNHDESGGEVDARAAMRAALPHMRPTDWVLDIGCQTGVQQELMRERGIRNTIGLDLYPNRAIEKGICLIKSDMHRLPFGDAAFDFVYTRDTLEHSPYPIMVVVEMHRVLRPGGKAWVSMPIQHDAPYHFVRYSAAEWRATFALFTILEETEGTQYTALLQKGVRDGV